MACRFLHQGPPHEKKPHPRRRGRRIYRRPSGCRFARERPGSYPRRGLQTHPGLVAAFPRCPKPCPGSPRPSGLRNGVRQAPPRFIISPPTWAAWASSRATKPCACSRCSSTPIYCWRPESLACKRYFLFLVRLRLCRGQATIGRGRAAQGRGRLPGHARGWLRLGKAVQRAHVPALSRGLRLGQRVARFHNVYGPRGTWTAVGKRRPPPSAARWLEAKTVRPARNRDLGRWPANAQLHVH